MVLLYVGAGRHQLLELVLGHKHRIRLKICAFFDIVFQI